MVQNFIIMTDIKILHQWSIEWLFIFKHYISNVHYDSSKDWVTEQVFEVEHQYISTRAVRKSNITAAYLLQHSHIVVLKNCDVISMVYVIKFHPALLGKFSVLYAMAVLLEHLTVLLKYFKIV